MKYAVSLRLAALVLAAFSVAPVFAADPSMPARGPVPFESMDADRDGFLSEAEYRYMHSERLQQRSMEQSRYRNQEPYPNFRALDSDRDGRVNRAEFQAHQRQRMQQRQQERLRWQYERMPYPGGSMGPGGGMGGGRR